MIRPRLPRPLLAVALALCAQPVASAETAHVVAAGESASSIARRYYGDFELTELLLAYNGRGDTVLHPGESLRIPRNEIHRVHPGDSWSGIATRHLGRPSAWRAIATLNGLPGSAVLQPGQEIVLPVVLDLDLRRGESLARLATRFYGEPELASMLAEFNDIDDPRRISVGQRISVPLVAFRPGPAMVATPPAAGAPGPEPVTSRPVPIDSGPPPPDPEFERALQAVDRAWRVGEYAEVLGVLEELDPETAAPGQRLAYWRWMAFVMVAFDAPERACGAWSELGPDRVAVELDPDLVSPKIREVLAGCPS